MGRNILKSENSWNPTERHNFYQVPLIAPGSDGPVTGRKDEPYAVLTMRGRTVHINVLSIAIKGIFILKHDFFPFQFCLTAGFNNAFNGPSIKYYDNHSVFLTPPISYLGSFLTSVHWQILTNVWRNLTHQTYPEVRSRILKKILNLRPVEICQS